MRARMEMGKAGRLALLWALYFSEGLPFGFQAKALPLYLKERGVSLAAIGAATVLSLPWMFKFAWAPLVDRFGSRKAWILPLQALLALSAVAAAILPLSPGPLFALIFLQNLFAATMDIAVDGLAVDLLRPEELGHGNAAQVAGYKVGMLATGGVLVWLALSAGLGWGAVFGGMAVLVACVMVVLLLVREPGRRGVEQGAHVTFGVIARAMWRAVSRREAAWLAVLILGYKLGETVIDAMWKPFLIERGFTAQRIALWINLVAQLGSIVGSIVGGIIAARVPLARALIWVAAIRVVPLVGETLCAAFTPDWHVIVAVSISEEIGGGLLTTVMFARMMAAVDPKIGATHYTAMASLELGGKFAAGFPSGLLAQALGFTALFAAGTAASVVFVLLAWLAARSATAASATPSPARQ